MSRQRYYCFNCQRYLRDEESYIHKDTLNHQVEVHLFKIVE